MQKMLIIVISLIISCISRQKLPDKGLRTVIYCLGFLSSCLAGIFVQGTSRWQVSVRAAQIFVFDFSALYLRFLDFLCAQ